MSADKATKTIFRYFFIQSLAYRKLKAQEKDQFIIIQSFYFGNRLKVQSSHKNTLQFMSSYLEYRESRCWAFIIQSYKKDKNRYISITLHSELKPCPKQPNRAAPTLRHQPHKLLPEIHSLMLSIHGSSHNPIDTFNNQSKYIVHS